MIRKCRYNTNLDPRFDFLLLAFVHPCRIELICQESSLVSWKPCGPWFYGCRMDADGIFELILACMPLTHLLASTGVIGLASLALQLIKVRNPHRTPCSFRVRILGTAIGKQREAATGKQRKAYTPLACDTSSLNRDTFTLPRPNASRAEIPHPPKRLRTKKLSHHAKHCKNGSEFASLCAGVPACKHDPTNRFNLGVRCGGCCPLLASCFFGVHVRAWGTIHETHVGAGVPSSPIAISPELQTVQHDICAHACSLFCTCLVCSARLS